jgi:DHA3 family macrolide efflux protein-like MFS transporter
MSDTQTEPLRLGVVLAPPFRSAFAAQSLVELADEIFLVALAWAVLNSGSSLRLGLVLTTWAVPRGVFLLLGGVIVDRMDSRVLAAVAGGALALVNLLLFALTTLRATPLAAWLCIALVLGVLDGIRLPIGYSMIPLVVPEENILAANRWSQLRMWIMLMLGPSIGGVLTATIGSRGAFVTVAVLYTAACGYMLRLPPLRVEREATTVREDFAQGLRLVARNEVLRLILPVFAIANLFVIGLTTVAIPTLIKLVLHGGAQGLGFVSGAFGAGLVVGTLSLGRLPKWSRNSLSGLFCLFALSDAALACAGLANSVPTAAIAFAGSGFFIGPASTLYQATLQSTTPPEYLGRVTGLARAISFGLEPVSGAFVGAAANAFGAGATLVTGGTAAVCADVFAVFRSLGRRRVAATSCDSKPESQAAAADALLGISSLLEGNTSRLHALSARSASICPVSFLIVTTRSIRCLPSFGVARRVTYGLPAIAWTGRAVVITATDSAGSS